MTLGVDIGGTTINLGLVEGAVVVKKVQVPSFAPGAALEETLDYLGDRIADVITPPVKKIGIGVPSVTDPVRGIVYDAVNIPSWKEVHLKETLEKRFGIPVNVNNDANCYALGAAASLGETLPAVVAVTLGTGTGAGIVIDGKIFNGTHCGAGELASVPYESLDYESFCSKKFFTANGVEPKEASQELMDVFGFHLGRFLSVILYAYDADCIILGGGIAHAFDRFRDALWKSLRESFLYSKTLDDLRIVAMPDEDVPLVGAASL